VGNQGNGNAIATVTHGHGLDIGGAGSKVGTRGVTVYNMAVGFRTESCDVGMHIVPSQGPPPQRTIDAQIGMIDFDGADLWLCIAGGNPGTWRRLAGTGTAGALTVLPTPARIYDSRPGSLPNVGSKSPVPSGGTRVLDLKVNSSGVPAGATAALLTVLLVNAGNGNGNATVWANGVAKPQANTMVWGGSTGRFTATAVSAVDPQARIQFSASLTTDVVIDVVGFYR